MLMSAIEATDVRALREQILERGGRTAGISDVMLRAVLSKTDDVDLAATAITMCPRPAWVRIIIPKGAGMPR
jgi:hypothetical protein